MSTIMHPLTGEPWEPGQSGLLVPAANPERGRFGYTRKHDDGSPKFHGGVDLVADMGAPVFAPLDGEVSRAGEQTTPGPPGSGFGKRVYLVHAGGVKTCCAHLSGILVKQGRKNVRAGDLIGWAGRSGNITIERTHVHFGVKVAGTWIDPLAWVEA